MIKRNTTLLSQVVSSCVYLVSQHYGTSRIMLMFLHWHLKESICKSPCMAGPENCGRQPLSNLFFLCYAAATAVSNTPFVFHCLMVFSWVFGWPKRTRQITGKIQNICSPASWYVVWHHDSIFNPTQLIKPTLLLAKLQEQSTYNKEALFSFNSQM